MSSWLPDNNDDGDCVFACNDSDLDDVCNDVDNCPAISNSDQANYDGDSLGDALTLFLFTTKMTLHSLKNLRAVVA